MGIWCTVEGEISTSVESKMGDNIKLPPLHYDELPEHTQKGDMRLKDGKLWVCSDPDINRWVCPDDRGWQLVPKEPTDEMKKAGCRVPLNKAARHNACYKVMLSAAPKFGEKKK